MEGLMGNGENDDSIGRMRLISHLIVYIRTYVHMYKCVIACTNVCVHVWCMHMRTPYILCIRQPPTRSARVVSQKGLIHTYVHTYVHVYVRNTYMYTG